MSLARNTPWKLRLSSLVAALCYCILTPLALGQPDGGEARITSDRLVQVSPGKIVTAGILIANRGDADADYEEQLVLPAGWRQISPQAAPIRVAAGTEQLRLVAFAVPLTSAAGSFDVDYRLVSSRTLSPVASATVTVVVLPVAKLDVAREDQTDTVIAGDTYEVAVRVTNRGNSRVKISLTTVSAPVCPVRVDEADFTLEAGSSRVVRGWIKTDAELRKTSSQVVNFHVTAVDEKGTTTTAKRTVVVTVIPRISGDQDPYVRLPTRLRLMSMAEDGRSSSQAEYSGAGFIDEDRQRRVDFLFRGPSLDGVGLYGLRNEYRMNYFGPAVDVLVGDQNYPLSPMTQRFSYGRGVGVNFHPGETSAGAFVMETADRTPNFQAVGSFVRREVTPTFSLQANALHKTYSEPSALPAGAVNIVSLQPRFDFGEALNLELEYGMSDAGSGAEAQASRVEGRGRFSNDVVYAVERVQAGNHYFGEYHGTEQTQATVTFPIHGNLRGKAAFDQTKRGAETTFSEDRPLPQGILSTRQTSYRPGLLYRVSPQTDVSLEYQNVERNVERTTGDENSLEHSIRVGVGHGREKFSVQTFAEFGFIEKQSAAASGGTETEAVDRYSVYLSYRPTVRQSYSIYGTLGSSAVAGVTERSKALGASAQWTISKQLTAGVNYARNEYDSLTARVQDTAAATASYTLENQNVVSVQGRWIRNSATQEATTSVMVGYTIPFGLRGLKKKGIGVIRGKIVEQEGERLMPMPRVVVTANGITAVTNHRGEFVFPSLKPGLYQLNVEQRSLGVDLVTRELLPLMIEVNKEEVVELSLSVVRAAKVSATIAVFAPAARTLNPEVNGAADAFKEVGGFGGGLVELTDGKQVLRQVTDSSGTVSFDRLRPGKWTLRVYQNNLPEHHVIETPEIVVELEPGQTHLSRVRILPRTRRVILIDEGTVVSTPRR